MKLFNVIFQTYIRIIHILLNLGMASLLLIGLSGIVLRWMGLSPLWIDPLVRHLVLLVAFLGAALATQKLQHIKIDVFSTQVGKAPRWLQIVINKWVQLVTILVSGYLTYASYQFFQIEREYPQPSFLGLQTHHLVFIIPLGFGLVTLMGGLRIFHPEPLDGGHS